jgi:hypothetical protein
MAPVDQLLCPDQLKPTQPDVQWVSGGKALPERHANESPSIECRGQERVGVIPPPPLQHAWCVWDSFYHVTISKDMVQVSVQMDRRRRKNTSVSFQRKITFLHGIKLLVHKKKL